MRRFGRTLSGKASAWCSAGEGQRGRLSELCRLQACVPHCALRKDANNKTPRILYNYLHHLAGIPLAAL